MAKRLRAMRLDDDTWEPAVINTARRGTSVTAIVTEHLNEYNRQCAQEDAKQKEGQDDTEEV